LEAGCRKRDDHVHSCGHKFLRDALDLRNTPHPVADYRPNIHSIHKIGFLESTQESLSDGVQGRRIVDLEQTDGEKMLILCLATGANQDESGYEYPNFSHVLMAIGIPKHHNQKSGQEQINFWYNTSSGQSS
jgi:hypothetical protein